MLEGGRTERLAATGLGLDASQMRRLEAFESLLGSPGASRGVISKRDVDRIFERHILDSLRAVAAVRDDDQTAYDLGAGGGLPGIPVSIAVPHLVVTLVESRANRSSFLRLVASQLELPNLRILAERIQRLEGPVDLCFARALAPARESWNLARPLLRSGGRLVYFAGAGFDRSDLRGLAEFPDIDIHEPLAIASGGPLAIMSRP